MGLAIAISVEIQLKTKVRFSVCVFHANELFCFFKTKQIRFPVPLFCSPTNFKKSQDPAREKFRMAAAPPREQFAGTLPSVSLPRSAGSVDAGSLEDGAARGVSYARTTRDADSVPPPPPSRSYLLRTRTKTRAKTPARDPAHFRNPAPTARPLTGIILDRNHRSKLVARLNGREPGGAPRSVRVARCGEGAQREAAQKAKRTCCKEVAGGGAACRVPRALSAGWGARAPGHLGRAPRPWHLLGARHGPGSLSSSETN